MTGHSCHTACLVLFVLLTVLSYTRADEVAKRIGGNVKSPREITSEEAPEKQTVRYYSEAEENDGVKMKKDSFIEFLNKYGKKYPPALGYDEDSDLISWQKALKQKLIDLRAPMPKRVEPTVKIVETVEEPDHTRYFLQITVSEISTLPAYLLVPHGMEKGEKRPGLLASHGHAKYGMDSLCGLKGMEEERNRRRAYALFAVRSGYVVLVPAWWGWPGRDGHVEQVGGRDKCNTIQFAASMYGLNVIDLHIQDAQAAVDVLIARDEVDPDQIGCFGNSYGGRTAMWFAIFDERIKACVAAGCMNRFRERSLGLASCGIQYPHGLLKYADVEDLFCLIAPRPLQLHIGKKDPLINPADRDLIETTVRSAYRKGSAEENLDYALHEDRHILLWDRAESFFNKHLPIKQDGSEKQGEGY